MRDDAFELLKEKANEGSENYWSMKKKNKEKEN